MDFAIILYTFFCFISLFCFVIFVLNMGKCWKFMLAQKTLKVDTFTQSRTEAEADAEAGYVRIIAAFEMGKTNVRLAGWLAGKG